MGLFDLVQYGLKSLSDAYSAPNRSQFDYEWKQFAQGLPLIGSYLSASDHERQMSDYLKNRGLDWSDVRYNQAPFGQMYGGAIANMVNSAPVTAMSLYKNITKSRPASKWEKKRRQARYNIRRHKLEMSPAEYKHRMRATRRSIRRGGRLLRATVLARIAPRPIRGELPPPP